MLDTGYFVKITKINSQQEKNQSVLIAKICSCRTQKNHQSAKINSCKNFVPHGISWLKLVDWVTDYLTSWMNKLLTYWLTYLLANWLICWLTDSRTEWMADFLTEDWFTYLLPDPGQGGALGYFLGGYVPPGTPNWHLVLKKFRLKLIPRSRNEPIFYTPF